MNQIFLKKLNLNQKHPSGKKGCAQELKDGHV